MEQNRASKAMIRERLEEWVGEVLEQKRESQIRLRESLRVQRAAACHPIRADDNLNCG
jgi:hypothetical protein